MTSATAEVISADAREVTAAKTSDAGSAEATDVASAKTAHVAAAEAAHVASATTTVSSATAAAAGLCTRGKKAAGKHRTCQDHHHSSSHDILHSDGRTFRLRVLSDVGVSRQSDCQRRDRLEMGMPVCRLY
jgi:hypothetical protein